MKQSRTGWARVAMSLAVVSIVAVGCGTDEGPDGEVPVGPSDTTFGTPAPVDNSVTNGNNTPANPAEPTP